MLGRWYLKSELKYSSVLMIQQMGFWFAKTKGVKRDKQTTESETGHGGHECVCVSTPEAY